MFDGAVRLKAGQLDRLEHFFTDLRFTALPLGEHLQKE